jgi:hypothetical protein
VSEDLYKIDVPEWLDTYCEYESSCTKLMFKFDTYKMMKMDDGFYEATFPIKDHKDAFT